MSRLDGSKGTSVPPKPRIECHQEQGVKGASVEISISQSVRVKESKYEAPEDHGLKWAKINVA